jgi:Protein of unknown function DUF262/Protein of unknown function (DUF1524)
MNDSFKLNDIADWQLNPETSEVLLPSVQRGFVWKPKQVEDLWDSLLRGYPIGSFLFSETEKKLYLMDGQQRATSIFLGHFNPFKPSSETQAWSIKGKLPVMWIDIKPGDHKPTSSRFLIRVTTFSHPWGYQAIENSKPLSVTDRRDSLELFKKHSENIGGYTTFKNSTVFPFDAHYPIPLCFFVESESAEEITEKVREYLPEYFKTKKGGFENKIAFLTLLEGDLKEAISEIYSVVRSTKGIVIKSNIITSKVLNEENDIEDPTLFVRINSSGTELKGDDLIYSIYKSAFPDAKNLIEQIGMTFIAPTQVLSFVSRLVASNLEGNRYFNKFKVIEFQRKVKDENFNQKLKGLIESKELVVLFERALNILSCKENASFEGEIPPVIIKHFIAHNPDLFLFLIYWLYINEVELTDQIKLKIASKLFIFSWFGFGNVPRLWKEKIGKDSFWSEHLNELIWWDGVEGIHFLIRPDLLKNYYSTKGTEDAFCESDVSRRELLENDAAKSIINYFNTVKSLVTDKQKANEYFKGFINKVIYNRQLLLFVQREYINLAFGDFNQIDNVEDTNVPWDWDHIYPQSWVYNMKNCEQMIRDWNNTIGNLRALSLEQNRSEGNIDSPKVRMKKSEIRYISFVLENDWEQWYKIDQRIWEKDKAICHFRACTSRMINIYQKLWDDLKIGELITSND